LSEPILDELTTVLRRPKFEMRNEEINEIILALIQTAEMVSSTSNFEIVREDPDDDIILRTGFDGKANMIVTGYAHLLRLKTFRGIEIVRISEAISSL
jgi:uncharacterized protein